MPRETNLVTRSRVSIAEACIHAGDREVHTERAEKYREQYSKLHSHTIPDE